MRRTIRGVAIPLLALLLTGALAAPAFAITEADVQAQVAATSKASVTGNVLIWFLCAVAFLKVSQKMDSFMASLGINVGHTGGSMLSEVLIATRGVATIAGAFGGGGGRRSGGASAGSGSSGSSGAFGGFLKGGLAGVVSRKVTSDAVKTATTSASAVSSIKSTAAAASQASTVRDRQTNTSRQTESQIDVQRGARTDTQTDTQRGAQTEAQTIHAAPAQTISQTVHQSEQSISQTAQQTERTVSQAVHQSEQSVIQPAHQSEQTTHQASTQTTAQASHTTSTVTHTDKHVSTPAFKGVGLGGAIFAKSLLSGGSFANDVIGTVARGDIRSAGSITGDLAAQSLQSYLGYAGDGAEGKEPPTFSNVEIGGGRITGVETAPGSSEGLAFGMYHAGQYTAPQGDYAKVHSADGALWYKQYAQDAVERKPYKAPDDTVAYQESILKKLPDPPKRKDRI